MLPQEAVDAVVTAASGYSDLEFSLAPRGDGRPDRQGAVSCFTTRVDTIYGASALVLSPNHPLLPKLMEGSPNASAASVRTL